MPGLLDMVFEQSPISAPPEEAGQQQPQERRGTPTLFDAVTRPEIAPTYGALATARVAAENEAPSVLRQVAQRLPFIRSAFNFGDAIMNDRAEARIAQGQGAESDFARVASHERLQQFKADMAPGERLGEAIMDIPATLIEARGAGALLGNRLAPAAGASLANRAGMFASQSAATAGIMGNWLPRWAENNREHGRTALDIRGLPPAFAHETATMAVLGSLGHFGDAVGANNIGGFLQRGLARTALGMGEQAGLDIATSAVQNAVHSVFDHDLGLESGYGLIGQIARGESGNALQTATTQALTFAVFAGTHEANRTPIMREYSAALRGLRQSGVRGEAAGERLNRVGNLLEGAAQAGLDRSEAQSLIRSMVPEGSPERRYAEAVAVTYQPKFGPYAERQGPQPFKGPPEATHAEPQGPSPGLEPVEAPNKSGAPRAPEAKAESWIHSGTKFKDNAEGNIAFTGRNGADYTLHIGREVAPENVRAFEGQERVRVVVRDTKGNEAGHVDFYKTKDGSWQGEGLSVKQGKDRRTGVAVAMYDAMAEMGERVAPSEGRTPEGKAFWARNKERAEKAAPKERVESATVKPDSLIPTEIEQTTAASLEATRKATAGGKYKPVVTIKMPDGESHILDGHHTAAVAAERGDKVPTLSISKADYDAMRAAKFSDLAISQGVLRASGHKGLADALAKRFDKKTAADGIEVAKRLSASKPAAEKAAPERRPASDLDGPYGTGLVTADRERMEKDHFEAAHPKASDKEIEKMVRSKLSNERAKGDWGVFIDSPHASEVGIYSWHPSEAAAHSAMMKAKQDIAHSGYRLAVQHVPSSPPAKTASTGKAPASPTTAPKPSQAQDPTKATPNALAGQKEAPKPATVTAPSAASITKPPGQSLPRRSAGSLKGFEHPALKMVASQMGLSAGGSAAKIRERIERKGGKEALKDMPVIQDYLRQAAETNLIEGKVPVHASIAKALDASKLHASERAAFEGALSGLSYDRIAAARNAEGKPIVSGIDTGKGVSHETVRKYAERTFEKLKKENPEQFEQYPKLEYLRTEKQAIDADRLSSQIGGEPVTEKTMAEVRQREESLAQTIDDAQAEHDLYKEEVERKGKSYGLSDKRIQEDAERASEEELADYRRKRGFRPPKSGEKPNPEPAPTSAPGAAEPRTAPVKAFPQPVSAAEQRVLPGGGQENAGATIAPPKLAAIANAHIDAWRESQGMSPILSDARKADLVVWDRAMDVLGRDPAAGAKLVSDLIGKPRSTTAEENALLLQRTVALRNERARTTLELVDAYRKRLTGRGSPENDASIAQLEQAESDQAKAIDEVDKASRVSGSEWGRAGRWRRMLMADDYSLAGLLRNAEVAKGRSLTEPEKTEIADLHKKITELQAKLDEAEKTGRVKPGEASDEGFAVDQVKKKWERQLVVDRQANAPWHVKAFRLATEALNLPRAIMASIDFPLFRQGGVSLFSHPVRTAKAIPEMLKSFFDEKVAARAQYEIEHRPNADLYKQAGLDITSPDASVTGKEEGFLSNVLGAESIAALKKTNPKLGAVAQVLAFVPRASERSYMTVMNRIRADSFDAMAGALSRKGELTQSEAKVIANYVNVMTGRGPLGVKGDNAVGLLNAVFFAPRWTASRFQMVLGQPLVGHFGESAPRARMLIAQEYGRLLSGLSLTLGLAIGAGLKVVLDPRSAAFGQVQMGNTFLDLSAGLRRPLVLLSRLWTGQTVNQFGVPSPIRGNVPHGQADASGIVGQYIRSSLAPIPGASLDLVTGENAVGQPTSPGKVVANMASPLFLRDVADAVQDMGVEKAAIPSLLALMGASMSTRDQTPRPPVPVTPQTRQDSIVRGQLQILQEAMRGQRRGPNGVIHGPRPNEQTRQVIQRQIDSLVRLLP